MHIHSTGGFPLLILHLEWQPSIMMYDSNLDVQYFVELKLVYTETFVYH